MQPKHFCPEPISTEGGTLDLRTADSLFASLTADQIKFAVRDVHKDEGPICDDTVDRMLGLEKELTEIEIQKRSTNKDRYPGEQIWEGGSDVIWTPYTVIRSVVHRLALGPDDVFCDIGAGYGRVSIYTAITTQARTRGIELVTERAEKALRAIGRLSLTNAEFINGNVLDQDYSDVTVFYAYHPFSVRTFSKVGEMLKSLARQRPIKIVSRRDAFFQKQPWLVHDHHQPFGPYSVFRSKTHPELVHQA